MKKLLLFGLLLAGLGLTGCEFNQLSEDGQVEELLLVPKQQIDGQKAKTTSNQQQTSEYSCLISTLADDEAEYNYWNQSFWVHFPKPAVEQAEGKTIFKAFSYGSEHAGAKAGSWAGKDNIVRVAQCVIPDSKLAETLLEEQLRKFGRNTWLESRKATIDTPPKDGAKAKSTSGDWECGHWFTLWACVWRDNSAQDCVEVGPFCAYYVFAEDPDDGGGGGGGDDGFPGDDPGECDPQGTEPCFDGGGGSIPPPEPDPCEESNPPDWCACEDTDDPNLDNEGIKEEIHNLMVASNANDSDQFERKEQGMWIIQDPITGEYGYSLFDEGWSNFTPCNISYNSPPIPPNAVAMVHTQPFAIGEIPYPCHKEDISPSQLDAFIQINPALRDHYEYKGAPSKGDLILAETIQSQGLGIKFYLVDKDGITEYDEDSPTNELGNAPRHTQSCYQN